VYQFIDVAIVLKPIQQQEQLSLIPPINFKAAFEELCNKHELLTCGIEKIDSILKLTAGDRLAVIGNRKYTQTIITRLCVNAPYLHYLQKRTIAN
jgi:hypothetical protein